ALHYPTLREVSPSDVLAPRLRGKRVILALHSRTDWSETSGLRRIAHALAVRLADHLVVTTPYLITTLARVVPARVLARKAVVIPSGVEAAERRPTQREARDRLGLPHDAIVGCTVCRVERHKGL